MRLGGQPGPELGMDRLGACDLWIKSIMMFCPSISFCHLCLKRA